jgi:hypothetical protein
VVDETTAVVMPVPGLRESTLFSRRICVEDDLAMLDICDIPREGLGAEDDAAWVTGCGCE